MATPYPSVEVQIDFHKIADSYVEICNKERGQLRFQAFDYPDAPTILQSHYSQQHNFRNLELKLCEKDVEWPDNIIPMETTVQKNFENPLNEAGIFGDFGSEQDVASINTVTITKGLMQDIGQTLLVPFPDKLGTVSKAMGGYLKIDPSKSENVVKQIIKVRGNLGRESIPQEGVTGVLVSREKTYHGKFSGKIYPKGKVVLKGGKFGEQDIQAVIRKVSRDPGYHNLLKHMTPDTKPGTGNDPEFFWKIEGFCDLRWDFQHDMKWQEKK